MILWHTDDTDVDESDSDESEREHPDYTDVDENVSVEETDLGKTEKEEPDDTDVKESDSGNKDQYEDEDHHPKHSNKIRSLTSYYLRNHNRNRPY